MRLLPSSWYRFLLSTLLPALVLAQVGCAGAPAHRGRPTPVILVSIDGFRADYLDRGHTPNLSALAADGVRAEAMRPAFPSLTFPNHYTLVTGLYPDHHGIVHNRMEDPLTGARYVYNDETTTSDPSWWEAGEPVWVTVEKHGMRTATMFWPGSNAKIHGEWPSHWKPFDRSTSAQQRVETLLHRLDLPRRERPVFLTLYFDQVDHAGHDFGPDAPQLNEALAEVDRAIGTLVDGLRARGVAGRANLVIVSDHGLAPSGPDKLVFIDDIIDVQRIRVSNYGIVAGMHPRDGDDAYVEETLLHPHDHMQCWRRDAMPARLHYGTHPRVPPVVCLAAVGWQISTHEWARTHPHDASMGEHGYDIDAPEMAALFVANGPAFRHGLRVAPFDNVHVYPLLMELLRLPAKPNDGDPAVTAPMLAPERRNPH
jgi:predicted AlkP superfamily pyrophosphatase or phosphodiesterase